VVQKDVRDADLAALMAATSATPKLVDPRGLIGDLADTAAIMAQMDLVISVDTAAAHLAGSLGRPLWLLLPAVPDWRWLLHREDSPWYPTARLFRQRVAGDWEDVVARVAAALAGPPGG
jgi:ADP-heptose:LPS heptosyltransferase